MPTIAIRFPARRYHATPWDAHVNEGRIEWPPCPWRLLRAMIAVGYNKLGWKDSLPDDAASLIEKLAGNLPTYHLPQATETHTRHYMPARDGKAERPVKVFDAFLRFVDRHAKLLVRFDVTLTEQEEEILKQLASGMAYLGRAESWVEAELISEAGVDVESDRWCRVATADSRNRVRLLTAYSQVEFDAWREQVATQAANYAERAEREKLEAKGKKLPPAKAKKVRENAERPYPTNLLAAIQQETSNWQNQGWPHPPGTRWIQYALPGSAFDRQPLSPIPVARNTEEVEAMILSVDGEGVRGTLRPLLNRALPLMELLHAESVRHATRTLGLGHIEALMGKDTNGKALRDHSHAHWLPLSLGDDRHIDHVLVYAPGKLPANAVRAIGRVRWAYAKGIRALSINVAGQASISDIRWQLMKSPTIRQNALHAIDRSRVWESVTPLVLRKYLHRRGKKTVEGQIREELAERGIDGLEKVDVWSPQEAVNRKLKGFVLRRKSTKAQPPCERSWAATLTFAEPVVGPLCLGYASHFGLGMFGAVGSDDKRINR